MADLSFIAKAIIFIGALLTLLGILLLFSDKIPWFGKLPGDIYVHKKDFNFYFPITTCIIISILLSIVFYFISKR